MFSHSDNAYNKFIYNYNSEILYIKEFFIWNYISFAYTDWSNGCV